MGGHSLRAAQLINMIHKRLDKEIPLKTVFEQPTLHLMSRWIEQGNEGDMQGFSEIQPVAEQEHYPVHVLIMKR
ncbi:phosphopantetheine-binding protein [Lysinibacillus sphaericus]